MARATIYCPCYTEFEEFITGHHVYKAVWTPTINEELICEREPENEFDRNAIKVVKDGTIVGHVPRKFAKVFTYVLMSGGHIVSKVTGPRQNKRNNGLEVPCRYRIKGHKKCIYNAECIIQEMLTRNGK